MKKKKQAAKTPKWPNLPFIIGMIAIAVFFTNKAIQGGELNYDDERYITHNELIKDLNAENVGQMFSSYFDGHYHPLTLLSLAIDGAVFEDAIRGHHLVNWVLHMANAALVYLVLMTLFKNRWLSFGVALLFVLHPMNVESYAWMTERKNVLYSFFFLASMLVYLRYLSSKSWTTLALCFLLFALSILSKAQAMMLLPVLFLLDWTEERDFRQGKLWLEKIPFLLGVLVFVFLTSSAQVEEWGDLNSSGYSQIEKIFLACTAFFHYFTKGIAPIDLSAYYPYPNDVGEELQWFHFASPVFLLLFLAAAVYAFRKSRVWFFGLAFFLVNVVLMLKFLDVPFGSYLMANRYNYLPLVGLMLVLALALFQLSERIGKSPQTKMLLLAALTVPYGIQSYNRIKVWNNSVSLWSDIIEEYPRYAHAYNMRGLGYIAEQKNAAAIQDFETILELDPELEDAYMNLAVLHFQMGQPKKAAQYVEMGKGQFPENAEVHKLAATVYLKLKNPKQALQDISKAVELQPENESFRFTKAQILVQTGKNEEAEALLSDLKDPKAQQLLAALQHSKNPAPAKGQAVTKLIDEGTALARQGKLREALQVYNQAIAQDQNRAVSYLNRGSTYAQLGDLQKARQDFQKALVINPSETRANYLLGLLYKDMGNRAEACENLRKAAQAGFEISPELRQYCSGG